MGLDMYLNKKTFIGAEYKHRNVTGKVEIKIGGMEMPIQFNRIVSIEECVGYWRKANQIHKWFVNSVQEGKDSCAEYYVSEEKLKELLSECKNVKENVGVAAEVLPTQPGFFFGGTDYDDSYLQDIDDTIKIIEQAISEGGDYYYTSSW